MNNKWGNTRTLLVMAKRIDWEKFGHGTALSCREDADAIATCALHLQAYEDQLQPELSSLNSEISILRNRGVALHDGLYDRPLPVNDASMLTHRLKVRILFLLCLFTAGTCLTGNLTTFVLLGWGVLVAFLASVFITALPLGVGHLAYERLISGHRWMQTILIIAIAALGFAAFYQFGQARRMLVDRATAQSTTDSYVSNDTNDDSPDSSPHSGASEARVNGTLGGAAFLAAMAAELGLGFLVGLFVKLRTDEDYAAWKELKKILEKIVALEANVTELFSRVRRAKKQCAAGIRRAQGMRRKRTPYHKSLAALLMIAFLFARTTQAQTTEHEEGVLIDVSSSIGSGSTNGNLFQEYLHSTKKLLSVEPPNTKVWVSSIAVDSFGGVREILEGWTPDAHGIFTDNLNRARHQLATSFGAKSSSLIPNAPGTDIFGGLFHLKSWFESLPNASSTGQTPTRTIRIFSDMMNQTQEFPMPELLAIGPERMLERAKAHGLIVPLPHYKIYVYGASTAGLTPQSWQSIKRFWEMYFATAGAELAIYSAECDVRR